VPESHAAAGPSTADGAGTNDPVRRGLADLPTGEAGIVWIYEQLDRTRADWDLDDLVLVIDDSPLGRQVFRAGRRPFTGGWATRIARQAPSGLHTRPHLPISPEDEEAFVRLCALVLELDTARRLATRDALTGLPNRRAFDEELARAAEAARRYGWRVSLVVLDLDGFKRLNDELGHAAGDAVLRRVGHALTSVLRRGDLAARIGGDEFALLLRDVDTANVPEVLDRIGRSLREGNTGVSFSAGWATCTPDAEEPEELLTTADQRLYEDKRR
jgi:diguanylate cyclase (GGDEF)-like protein